MNNTQMSNPTAEHEQHSAQPMQSNRESESAPAERVWQEGNTVATTDDQLAVLTTKQANPEATPTEIADMIDDEWIKPGYVERVLVDFFLPPEYWETDTAPTTSHAGDGVQQLLSMAQSQSQPQQSENDTVESQADTESEHEPEPAHESEPANMEPEQDMELDQETLAEYGQSISYLASVSHASDGVPEGVWYECALCGFEHDLTNSLRTHIDSTTDDAHDIGDADTYDFVQAIGEHGDVINYLSGRIDKRVGTVDHIDAAILWLLHTEPGLTQEELGENVGLHQRSVRDRLEQLGIDDTGEPSTEAREMLGALTEFDADAEPQADADSDSDSDSGGDTASNSADAESEDDAQANDADGRETEADPEELKESAEYLGELDPDSSEPNEGIWYECTLCGQEAKTIGGIRKHISSTGDAKHEDRNGWEPHLIGVRGRHRDALIEVNRRQGDDGGMVDHKDFAILWHYYHNPESTQTAAAKKVGVSSANVARRLEEMGIDRTQNIATQAREILGPITGLFGDDAEDEDEDEAATETETDEAAQERYERQRQRVTSEGASTVSYEGPAIDGGAGTQFIQDRPVKTTETRGDDEPQPEPAPAAETEHEDVPAHAQAQAQAQSTTGPAPAPEAAGVVVRLTHEQAFALLTGADDDDGHTMDAKRAIYRAVSGGQ